VIVHALTTKGKGFPEVEPDYYRWHATGPFDLETGKPHKSSSKIPTTRQSSATRSPSDGEGSESRGADCRDA
jgi:deoxyxylulose-5-phosphate synthase